LFFIITLGSFGDKGKRQIRRTTVLMEFCGNNSMGSVCTKGTTSIIQDDPKVVEKSMSFLCPKMDTPQFQNDLEVADLCLG
jgi:hypothetical protein